MLTALLAALIAASASAAPVDDELVQIRAAHLAALEASRGLLVDAMPFSEQKLRLRDLKLIVSDDHPFHAAAASDGTVVVSWFLLARLRTIIALHMISATFQRHGLEERYLQSEVDALMFADAQLVSIERIAALTPDELKIWEAPESQGFLNLYTEWAGTFLLAHELGHHALQAFSSFSGLASNKDLEQRVDRWAAGAMADAGIPPMIGITWLMLYFATDTDYALEFGDPAALTHDIPAERARDLLRHASALSKRVYSAAPPWNAIPLATWTDAERQLIAIFDGAARERSQRDLRHFLAAADKGDVEAQLKVAFMYATGTKTSRDPARAHAYRLKAAHAGDPFAQVKVAEPLLNSGDPAQIARGLFWWRRAADATSKQAIAFYPGIREKGPRTAAGQRGLCIHDAFERTFAPGWTACLAQRRRACLDECVQRHGRAIADCREFLCPSRQSRRRHHELCATLHAGPERVSALWADAEAACP